MSGLANEAALPVGLPWQEPDGGWDSVGRTDLHTAIDTEGRRTETRSDFDAAYGDWDVLPRRRRSSVRTRACRR